MDSWNTFEEKCTKIWNGTCLQIGHFGNRRHLAHFRLGLCGARVVKIISMGNELPILPANLPITIGHLVLVPFALSASHLRRIFDLCG